MVLEATKWQDCDDVLDYTPELAITAGEVTQLADGRAGVPNSDIAASVQDALQVEGIFIVAKTTGINFLDGGRVFWDHSANKAHFRKVNDRDFYIGRAFGDAASAATTMKVILNVNPPADIDIVRDPVLSVPTGTQAVGGFGYPKPLGGANQIELTATSEAQCIDMLSVDRFALSANAIVEAVIRIPVNGSGAAVDFNIGVANDTDTADADVITESCFFHIDGAALDIKAESDDGTTEVNATDTNVDATAGSAVANRLEFWMDMRNPADIQLYIDGVNVLPDTVFTLAAAAGPLGLLAHLEKTTGTTTAKFVIDRFQARFAQK